MFEEYKFKDLLISLLVDLPFYVAGCCMMDDYVGHWVAGIVFLILCLISIERARSEEQDKQIHALKNELDRFKDELRNYKEQVLEG